MTTIPNYPHHPHLSFDMMARISMTMESIFRWFVRVIKLFISQTPLLSNNSNDKN